MVTFGERFCFRSCIMLQAGISFSHKYNFQVPKRIVLRVRCRLRDRSPVPIAAGENESGRLEFSPWIEHRALDYYQVDLGATFVIELGLALAFSTQPVVV